MLRKLALRRPRLPLFLYVALSIPVSAAAQDRPFFVEADIGRVSVDEIEEFPIDESTLAFRLGTGYHFLPWLGVSGAFVDLGKIESTFDAGNSASQRLETSADGFEVTVTGRIPLTEQFALTAQTGMFWWAADSDVGGVTASNSDHDVTWGVGAEYAIGLAFAATASWRRFALGNVDADAAWLGFLVRFGDATQ